tara:strand:+ start:350 stop:625 length:276 start_codon:yes stop_codon:yes gene_type:complete
VRHLVDFDLHAGRVVSMDVPAFVAHVACRQETDGAVAFAEDDAVVDIGGGLDECCVDCDVEGGEGVLVGAVEVGAFGWFADPWFNQYLSMI